jgi:TetR/AcrR family transcriptional regulator, cholesterol catabolism regulator
MTLITKMISEGSITDPESAKGKLLNCAAHLFKTKGFTRTTVRDIARDVGILSGSIFHHFPNKEAILCGVMREALLIATARMENILLDDKPPRQRLLDFIRCELEAIHGLTGEGFTLLASEWRSLSEENQMEILELREVYERLWLDVLDQAKAAGLIKMDCFLLRRFLVGSLIHTCSWYDGTGSLTLEKVAHEAFNLITAGESQ